MRFTYLSLLIISVTHLCVEAAYGGNFYPITEVPYQAQLNIKTPSSIIFCGATILNEYWLATAAHCVAANETEIIIRIGTSTAGENGIVFNVVDIVVHDKYNIESLAFDISLIKSEKKIEFNEYFYPIPISRTPPKIGDELIVSGYGNSHYGMFGKSLKISHVHVIDDEICKNNFTIEKTQFCTDIKNSDLCSGDSGGPAVSDDKLVGIISQGCEYNAPMIFIKVSEFYDWILEKTGITYD